MSEAPAEEAPPPAEEAPPPAEEAPPPIREGGNGQSSSVPPAGDPPKPAAEDLYSDASTRRWAAAASGVIGVGFVVTSVVLSARGLEDAMDTISGSTSPTYQPPAGPFYAVMAAHAVITVAAVYFGYSLIQAAERLLLPTYLLRDKKDVAVIRAALGIRSPTAEIARQSKAVLGMAKDIAQAVAEVLKSSK